MKEALPATRVVLIALDASPRSLIALETAARIASRLNTGLHAIYVEDENLTRTAALPFACAISSTGHSHELTPETMERQLRRYADIARKAVETAGNRSNIPWSFSVARGSVHREIARAASVAEFVTIGRFGWSDFRSQHLGSVARTLMEKGGTSLLMVGESGIREPIAILYDASPSSERALSLALAMDGRGSHPITVIVEDNRTADHVQRSAPQTRLKTVLAAPAEWQTILKASDARTVLVPATTFMETIKHSGLLDRNDLSLFVVR